MVRDPRQQRPNAPARPTHLPGRSWTPGQVARVLFTEPQRVIRQLRPRRAVAYARAWETRRRAPAAPQTAPSLSHAEALRENGFTIFRGLFSAAECAALAATMKQEAGIVAGHEFTRVDATNKFESTRRVLFDDRVLEAVRTSVEEPVRFLQVSDLHYLHDTDGWHRDSVHRAEDASQAADWSGGDYGVVKAILYMESENAAMGIMAGSHSSPFEIDRDFVKAIEKGTGQLVIGADDDPNRRFSAAERRIPVAWQAQAGDLLVFDERMYHAGRRVEHGVVTPNVEAPKFTLSLVFGPDNTHSRRLYSYFRYARRELSYRDFNPQLRAGLAERDLLLRDGLDNYYLDHPEELRLAHLRKPEMMDELVERFTREGEQRRAGTAG